MCAYCFFTISLQLYQTLALLSSPVDLRGTNYFEQLANCLNISTIIIIIICVSLNMDFQNWHLSKLRSNLIYQLSTYLPTYLPTNQVSPYLPTYLPSLYLSTKSLPTYLPTYLPNYLPTLYLTTYQLST